MLPLRIFKIPTMSASLCARRDRDQWRHRLKKLLLARKDEIRRRLRVANATYSLGRGLECCRSPVVRDIRRQAENNFYRFSF